MIKHSFLKFGSWVATAPLALIPSSVFAAAGKSGLEASQDSLTTISKSAGTGAGAADLPTLIGRLISVTLGVVGIFFVVTVVQAGIQYMTAGGDDTKVKEAKGRIQKAVIGIIIIVAAYSISNFVISQIITATSSAT